MTHYYTHGVPTEIGGKLLNSGMELKRDELMEGWLVPTYAEALDWLMEKGINIEVQWYRSYGFKWDIDFLIDGEYGLLGCHEDDINYLPDWYAAMDEAIKQAVRLLSGK